MNKKENKKGNQNKKSHNLVALIIVAVVVIIGIVIISLTVTKKLDDNSAKPTDDSKSELKAITEKNIIKDEEFEGLSFTNTVLVKDGDNYVLTMDVTNPTDKEIDVNDVNIVMADEDGNTIINLRGNVGGKMAANETRTITSSVSANDVDLSKAVTKTIKAYEPVNQK